MVTFGFRLWVLRVVVMLRGLERYSYVGVFEQMCDSSYFWAMVCERGPNFVFLLVVYVINNI